MPEGKGSVIRSLGEDARKNPCCRSPRRTCANGQMKHVMLKYMYVQDVVEKKLTNLAYINTQQNKADLMTSEAHKRGCAMIGLKLA